MTYDTHQVVKDEIDEIHKGLLLNRHAAGISDFIYRRLSYIALTPLVNDYVENVLSELLVYLAEIMARADNGSLISKDEILVFSTYGSFLSFVRYGDLSVVVEVLQKIESYMDANAKLLSKSLIDNALAFTERYIR